MSRLIDADELKERGNKQSLLYNEFFNRLVDESKTIEAEPIRHAHWVQSKEDGALFCSHCGRPSYDSHDEWVEFNGIKALALVYPYYCGYCGAKMDEVKDE